MKTRKDIRKQKENINYTKQSKEHKKKNKKLKTKKSFLYLLKRLIYYILFSLFLLGSILGILNLRKEKIDIISPEVDSFVKEYSIRLFSLDEDVKKRDERQEYLNVSSLNFSEILNKDNLKESKLEKVTVKNKNLYKEDLKDRIKIYDYILQGIQKIVEKTGTIQEQEIKLKLKVIHDLKNNIYSISMCTPYDYKINNKLEEDTKKKVKEVLLKKEIDGDPLSQNDQEILKNQFITFFNAYNTSHTTAQSLVGENVELPFLNGTFKSDTTTIETALKNNKNEEIKTIINVKFEQNKSTEFLKKYFVVINNKTIIKMEDI